jgi:HAD superfamily hydrolase (TIGR01509 family)
MADKILCENPVGHPDLNHTSVPPRSHIAAVSLDFFNTLANHRLGRGRGALVMDYFRAQGWASSPWEHAALYDVFAEHAHEFTPALSAADLRTFTGRVAGTLFRRLGVQADPMLADAHGVELWRILGPEHLTLFPEVDGALRQLRTLGLRVAVVSNWQHGLRAFCEALGVGAHLDVVVASAEAGVAKPDGRIFAEACRRLTVPPGEVLHVGDSRAEDLEGARGAGLQALWLCRNPEQGDSPDVVRSLDQVVERLAAT